MPWISLLVAIAVVLAPASSLAAAAWVPHLDFLPTFALAGALVGLAASRTPLRPFAAHVLGLGIGFELVIIRFLATALTGPWETRRQELYGKILAWLHAASQGGASTDTLMFAFVLALLAWTLGYFGIWFLLRNRNPWWAVLPSGVVLLLNTSYDTTLLKYFYLYLVAALLLLVVVDEWRRRERWRLERVPSQPAARTSLLAAAALAAPLLLIAWQFPPLLVRDRMGEAWANSNNPLLEFQTRFERLFSAVQARQGGVRALAFASQMAPRGAFELGTTPLLEIRTDRAQYWRANTLDTYTGEQMRSSDVAEIPAGPGAIVANPPQYQEREQQHQTVTILANQTSAVFAAGDPVTVDPAALLAYHNGNPQDFANLRLASPLRKGDEYSVTSSVSVASAAQLRAAGANYPGWVARYLQLPESLPQRVRDESARIAADATDPYDKALRIESYLRTFPYTTTDVPVPPAGRDWVDYMLFDARRGYCDYYATSMAVMLRTQGIPARVAQGFATGEWQPDTGQFLVRESQAHSWVEVYFPSYGWIVFEPSASRPLPYRPETPSDAPAAQAVPTQQTPDLQPDMEALRAERDRVEQRAADQPVGIVATARDVARVALLALMLLVAGVAVVLAIGYAVWTRGLRGLAWHQRMYAQTVRLASWCGLRLGPAQTPYEQARAVGRRVPAAAGYAATIAESYVAATYGHGASAEQRRASARAWRALRVLLPRRLLLSRLHDASIGRIRALRLRRRR